MSPKIPAALIAISLLASGCAEAPTSIRGKSVQMIADPSAKDVVFIGPGVSVKLFGGSTRTWSLRTAVSKDAARVTHQLYVDIKYRGDWRVFQSAVDDTGAPLGVEKIASSVDGCWGGTCSIQEAVGVSLSDAALKAHEDKGYRIRLVARNGEIFELGLSPEQIALQLDAVDGYVRNHPK